MAIDLCSENHSTTAATIMSPRISFSHNLSQSDINLTDEQRLLRTISTSSSTSVDFDFCIHHTFNQSTSADDLFSDGKILPTDQLKQKDINSSPKLNQKPPSPPPPAPPLQPPHYRNHLDRAAEEAEDQKQKSSSKSFWQFKRSSSCGNGYARSLCPLPILPRSHSTGSASSSKKSSSSSRDQSVNHKQQSQASVKQNQFSSNQKPPLRKNVYGSSHGNSVRVTPVLNVPSTNLFGLGSIFTGKKEEKKKKIN